MRKHISRLLALLLTMIMVFSLAACGGSTSDADSSEDAAESEPSAESTDSTDVSTSSLNGEKVGLLIYSTTTTWAINIIDCFEDICAQFGIETTVAEAGDPSAVMTAAENLAAAGVTGVMCMMDGSIGDTVQEYFDEKGIYVSYSWGNYVEADYFDAMAASDYYAGSVSSMDYEAAVAMTQHCIDLGADKWVFLGMPEGSGVANDNRALGFKDTLEENGLTLLAEVRSYDKVEGSQNLVTNYPELNGFGAGLNAAKNAGGVLEQAGMDGPNEVYMFCYEAAEDYVLEYFEAERLHGCADGCIGHMELALALLFNAMAGNKIVGDDGIAASYMMPYLIAYTAEEYTTMHEYTYDGAYPYTVEELADMLVEFNSDVDYATLESVADDFSIESIAARR